MAARRLLIVMLVLLGVSSVIAIVVPEPKRDDPPARETATTGETGATGTTGESGENDSLSQKDAEPNPASETLARTVELGTGKPEKIEAQTGARVILTVKAENGSEVEIEGLGLSGFADRFAPAVFDVVLPSEPGEFQVKAPDQKASATIVTE